ncbi:stage III sporulation protein AG [Cytobacillus horneckiae]|uniref:Stage III sporulation protein AG n=1 Tax=Cytobacillus horneckiae TaxID=549687 RepID=A0A2N0Z9L6_9BACI|nr:stage III sporulation protein AG [Cytobacillus horneckiae]NRG46751.1 stage III sporulation protein AG [Bacillus sp. CRN 9]MBN6888823.1 stage III sporulation protein AG [Cytobacillus horneckiae]MCM3179996.1 stage III sporulation protein AG [Cytobacillus horneckiae]MEC1155385.1 stage III sporulation protein AG [Cytobacillus horneckiae]MED2936563.1 stage III sporulation protein AG [Cytobacillus horneckiae]
MNKDKGPITMLKDWLTKDKQSDKKPGKFQYLVIVLLFGAAIMLISNLMFKDDKPNDLSVFNSGENNNVEEKEVFGQGDAVKNGTISDYEKSYEAQIKEALDAIVGVEDVTVVVNVDATEKKVLEKNKTTQSQTTDETDREGGKRTVEDQSKDEQLVIIREGEKEVPIVVETKKPTIRGVLIVAKGAENVQVKAWIVEAVSRVLDVPAHRVSVMPKKTKGDS